MDLLGLAAGVIAVLYLISKVIGCPNDVKGAPKECTL